MQPIYLMFAYYNAWANGRLYNAVSQIDEADYRADLGVFFGSLHGTLNHILVTDRIWMTRMTGEGLAPTALDAILCDALSDLTLAREAEDARIIGWVESLTTEDLKAKITYTPITDPRVVTQPLAPVLSHVFNHQTHHRGQCHAMLTRLTGRAPSLDLPLFQRETGMGML